MRNQEIVDILYEISELLEIQGEIQWKFLAYRRAARTIESLSQNIAEVLGKEKLPGIGKALEEKIKELVTTGKLEYYEELKKQIPPLLLKMIQIPEIGPKTAKLLYDSLHLKSLDDLEKAAQSHRIQRIKGIGPKTELTILKNIKNIKKPQRTLLGTILPIADEIIKKLKELKEVKQISVAGSIRRKKDTIRDIDILVTSDKSEKVMQVFTSLEMIKEVSLKGPTKSTVIVKKDIQVDLRVVEDDSFGAALQYFTGSKEHNVVLRTIASQMGYKLNEYGLFLKDTDEKVAGKTEEEIYKVLGMEWMPPELREDRGEILAAQNHTLPHLIEVADIKGDLHMHSNYSDGANSIEEMIEAAKKRGYEYIAITDHVGSLAVANAVDETKLQEQISHIHELNKQEKGIRVFVGAEINIDLEGNLELSEEVLKQLDIVIGSVHSKLKMPRKEITDRVTHALSNRYLTILGHPTGRLLNKRPGSDIDLVEIFEEARKHGKILEINSYPPRLDLSDVNCREASQQGILLSIGTDSHSVEHLQFMELGVSVARRGWLEKQQVLNTLPLNALLKKINIK
ncbi:MAG TPA: DNA polymerase/3'-5' exonuclease PolX [Candidatus Deferrimicrobium sp.]|nr:DNA polymerase/3'-5' exonuclease PolX [Candidatus Deferrimicrobium sp.]